MAAMIGVLICFRALFAGHFSRFSGDRKSKLRNSFKIMKCRSSAAASIVRLMAVRASMPKHKPSDIRWRDSLAPTSRPLSADSETVSGKSAVLITLYNSRLPGL